MKLNNVTLELSGKPFIDDKEETMYRVCKKMFVQWKNLTDRAEKISVMLWIADGSEILSYSGDLNQTFEWAYWQGCAEPVPLPENPPPRIERAFHFYPKKYRDDVTPRSYRWLKRMIEVLRECCMEINGKPARVVAIFDNGPEFCLSDFKYRWHNEICAGSTVGHNRTVVCNSLLHKDSRKYAAYPNGIPEGTPLGRFLGAQFNLYAEEIGYDAIWLSNGMGFGRDTWGISGFIFDKGEFHPENAEKARNTMLEFWKEFTDACPGMRIETRGSNFSAGVEIASDGAPLVELYDHYKIAPPVNSPWAALNFDTGLEIAAWMSHVAVLPDDRFPYRFYPHDPWFLNSPWLDRYGREPWDIYLPMSIGRISEDGSVQAPNSINLLTIDDSWGDMPDQVPQEVIPHLLEAFRSAADAPAPFVWVYPFRKYSEMVHGKDPHPETVFNEDLFIGETIQAGFPLNTVVAQENFDKVPLQSIVIMPVSAYGEPAQEFLDKGGRIVFYGALHHAPPQLLKTLGLKIESGITGQQKVTVHHRTDSFRKDDYADIIFNHDVHNGGPLTEAADGAEILAEAGGRVLASVNGNAAFVRSILPQGEEVQPTGRNLMRKTPDQIFPVETLLRSAVSAFGWKLEYQAVYSRSMLPRMNITRHENMFFFSVFARDTTASMKIRTPLGIPLLDEMETEQADGCAVWHPGKCWHKRCRVFIDQSEDSVFSLKLNTHEEPILEDKLSISGLKDATVRVFLPKLDFLEFVEGLRHEYLQKPRIPYMVEDTEFGKCAVVRNINGNLIIGILKKKTK